MHNTALEGSTGMNEIKTEKRNFYLRFSDWMDGALWRRALVLLALSSAVITDLLRDSLGFTGVILTDPLGGQTISAQYDEAKAAILALNAGADMLYELNDPEGVYTAILSAIQNGELTEERIDESVTRILCAKLQLQIIES